MHCWMFANFIQTNEYISNQICLGFHIGIENQTSPISKWCFILYLIHLDCVNLKIIYLFIISVSLFLLNDMTYEWDWEWNIILR